MANGLNRIASRKYAPAKLGRVLVLGLGKSGKAVTRYLLEQPTSRVESLTITAGRDEDSEQFVDSLEDSRVTVLFDIESFSESYDLCVASPGISQFSVLYKHAEAACAELVGEVEFAWRESREGSRWVAITGTNGKTTTTALTAHLLQDAEFAAYAVGNIGDTCIEAVQQDRIDVFVAEVSSYQLASTRFFAPDVALLLNITPDHLSWHTTFEEYVAAKMKLFANLDRTNGVAILDATDDRVRGKVREMKAIPEVDRGYSYLPIGTSEGLQGNMKEKCGSANSAFVQNGDLVVDYDENEQVVGVISDLAIKGEHNIANALFAASAALVLGAAPSSIRASLATFTPLEHRIEPCGDVDGVAYFNDSKATNVDAAVKALSAFTHTPPIILLGGTDKGTDLDDLVKEVEKGCKAAVCYGEAGHRFSVAFGKSSLPVVEVPTMEEAFTRAQGMARKGDVVLLSPACASFDEFDSFEHRGRVFKELVAGLKKESIC